MRALSPWVQTSESMCWARPQKGKKTTAAGENCFSVWTRIIRGICVNHIWEEIQFFFPLMILLDVFFAIHTLRGLVWGCRQLRELRVALCKFILLYIMYPMSRGTTCYWQRTKDSSRISVEGEQPHLPCASSYFPGALLLPDVSPLVPFSPVSPSLPHAPAHPIPSFHPGFYFQKLGP